MNFVYVQDDQDKSISFSPSVVYAPSRPTAVDGEFHKIKLENYNDLYSQNFQLNSAITCPHTNSQSIYSDFQKDFNGRPTETESPLKFSGKLLAPTPTLSQSSPVQNYVQQIPQMTSRLPMLISSASNTPKSDYRNSVSISKSDYCFNDNSVSSNNPVSGSAEHAFLKHQCLNDLSKCSQQSSMTQKPEQSLQAKSSPGYSSGSRTSIVSEALFVRIIVSRCKRIAPLWFRGISSMRERNREENRRTSNSSGQMQNDWSLISGKIKEMNQTIETDTVVNLLKKLYKELPNDSVLKFIRCWLGDSEALGDTESCVLSRPDAKGRMRRIDGGKGSDKVWRLDTIVGMLFHGLPMSSTDTNIMVHTCSQELCVRPQHIRFRASSVALVIVLKALAQAGYAIIPPPASYSHLANSSASSSAVPNSSGPHDEAVDVFGPFSIEELQQYRSENLSPAGESVNRVTLNSSDRELAEGMPLLKEALYPGENDLKGLSEHCQLHTINGGGMSMEDDMTEGDIKPISLFQPSVGSKSRFLPSAAITAPSASSSTSSAKTRRSLKRPAPTLGDPSSSSSSITPPPPSLQSEYDPPDCEGGVGLNPRLNQTLPDPNIFLMQQQQQQRHSSNNCLESHQDMDSTSRIGDPSMHQQQLPAHFTTQPAGGNIHQVQPLYAPQAIAGGSSGPPSSQQPSNSNTSAMIGQGVTCEHGGPPSGKSTPRQPAKKRLEARTPTTECVAEGISVSAFKVVHDTPFTPVLGSGQQQQPPPLTSSVSVNSGGVGRINLGPVGHPASVAAKAEEEDEEMKNIFLSTTRRHHSTMHPPNFDRLSINEMKQLQARLSYQQQLQPQLEPQFRGTPNSSLGFMKRCASACAVCPIMSHIGPGLTSPPPRLTPALSGSGGGGGGYDSVYQRDNCFSTPPPPPLGRMSVSKSESASNRAFMTTPDGSVLRDFASRIRDSPIAHTHPEIIEVLVSLAQEYGIQPNRSGSSCSRPRSNLIRSIFPGGDSPSPAGFTLNMLNNNMNNLNNNINCNSSNSGDMSLPPTSDGMEHLRSFNLTSNISDLLNNNNNGNNSTARLNRPADVFPPGTNFDHR